MTSNVGSRWIQERGASRREEMEARVTEALKSSFKPEFLNRIDETIIFHNLSTEQIGEIVGIQIKRLQARLAERNIGLILSDDAIKLIVNEGYDPVYGARPLKRAIQRHIENPLSMEILKGAIKDGVTVKADARGDKILFGPA